MNDHSDKSELLQLFLRKDAFEDHKYPELSKAVKYYKQTEGGRTQMCKTVEDYAKNYAEEYAKSYAREYAKNYAREYAQECAKQERLAAICNMIELGLTKEQILQKYSEEEYTEAEQSMLVQA